MIRNIVLLTTIILATFTLKSAAAEVPLTPIHIIIDVGHGGVDIGTSYHNLLEKQINLQMGKLLYESLTANGYHVILNRDQDMALSDDNHWLDSRSRHIRDLSQRKHLAAEVDPRLMISLHVNWADHPGRRGPLVLYQGNHQSFLLADVVQHSLNQFYRTKEEPIPGRTYYLLKHSICPTIIVEMGYISNSSDRALLTQREGQQKIIGAITSAINEYFLLMGEHQEAARR